MTKHKGKKKGKHKGKKAHRTAKQKAASRRNVKKAQRAARAANKKSHKGKKKGKHKGKKKSHNGKKKSKKKHGGPRLSKKKIAEIEASMRRGHTYMIERAAHPARVAREVAAQAHREARLIELRAKRAAQKAQGGFAASNI